MNQEEYAKIVKSKSKQPNILENAFISFLSGGVLGGAYQIITKLYLTLFNLEVQTALGWTCVTFILIGIILTGLGIFDKLIAKYKFGLIIPITGFAHSVTSSLMDYKRDGLITGMGSNMFKLAGCVILYGLVSAFILCIVKVIIYG